MRKCRQKLKQSKSESGEREKARVERETVKPLSQFRCLVIILILPSVQPLITLT
uniref:Uncharacterized protein n=1 Tax=Kalanchoe fedtschenkoi TaxID=63787 RepID=A0A7N0VEV3_KALFE